MEKWKVPTCKKCNSDYGRLEEELFVMLAMTVDPTNHGSSGIYQRALRSIDESQGKGKRDRLARRSLQQRVLKSMLHGDQIPNEGIYPGLGERWNRPREEQVALLVPAAHIRRLCEKIVRGVTYIENGMLIEPPFSVEFYALGESGAEPIKQILDRHGTVYTRGPGFEVIRVVPHDESRASMFKITVFGEFVMYAFVSGPEP
jgi:hypothetical protein